jgi:hypothetical protein
MISSAVLPFFSLKDWTITIGSFSLIVYSINYHEFFFVLKSTIGWLIVFTFLLAFQNKVKLMEIIRETIRI